MHSSALEAQIRIFLLLPHAWTQASSNISSVTWRKRMICKVSAMAEGAARREGWAFSCCFRDVRRSSLPIFPERLSHLGKLLQAPGREQRMAVKASAERNE